MGATGFARPTDGVRLVLSARVVFGVGVVFDGRAMGDAPRIVGASATGGTSADVVGVVAAAGGGSDVGAVATAAAAAERALAAI